MSADILAQFYIIILRILLYDYYYIKHLKYDFFGKQSSKILMYILIENKFKWYRKLEK